MSRRSLETWRAPKRPGVVAALVCALAVVLLASVPSAGAQDATTTASDAAIGWLDDELAANGGTLPGFVEGTVDWGLMGDFALARIATGRGSDSETVELAQRLLDNLGAYSTWDDDPATPGVRSAGALAKVYLVALGAGLDTTDVDGVDLEAELRSLMATDGDQAGRFSDRNPFGPDYSLAISQAYAMMGLAGTSGGVPGEAVGFLVDQQCPAGGFRLVYDDTPGCEDDGDADPDATALSVQALMGVERDEAATDAVVDALDWLAARQEGDGSFGGGEFTEAPNSNSTGLIAQTMRAAGRTGVAAEAAGWVLGELALGADVEDGPAAGERGAIAYDPAARTAALESGIAIGGRDQWRRSTSQGVLALGAAPFVDVRGEIPGGDEGTPESTTTTSTTTTTPGSSTTVVTEPPTTVADPAPGTAAAPEAQVGAANVLAAGAAPTGSASAEGAELAYTGASSAPLLGVGVALVSLGALAAFGAGVSRRRARATAS